MRRVMVMVQILDSRRDDYRNYTARPHRVNKTCAAKPGSAPRSGRYDGGIRQFPQGS
jgi:hypothetical protein